jgi:acyl carrier protein
MDEFLQKIAAILEVESLKEVDDLKSFEQWDSLAVLSIIAMLDANYGVNLRAADLQPVKTAGDLFALVQARRSA